MNDLFPVITALTDSADTCLGKLDLLEYSGRERSSLSVFLFFIYSF